MHVQQPDQRLWAAKVRPDRVRRLYAGEAGGVLDDGLLQDVGWSLYSRCQSVILVSRGQVGCPACGTVFPTTWRGGRPEAVNQCPVCGWSITNGAYHASWRHRDLIGTNALPAFEAFVRGYPLATSTRDQMLAIDRLINAFHQDLRRGMPHRSAANNLIEGSHEQVLTLLDELAQSTTADPEHRRRRAVRAEVRQRRQGSNTGGDILADRAV